MKSKGLISSRAVGIFLNVGLLFVLSLFLKRQILNYPVSVGWDEDVFRMIGQRWVLDGELPLVSTFENKPPFAYLPYAIPYVFTSVPTALFTNLVVIAISVFICCLLANIFGGGGFWARIVIGFVSLCAIYVLPQGLGWMTELNSLAFFVLPLLLLVTYREAKFFDFLMGISITMLFLTRTNMVFASMAFFYIYFIFSGFSKPNVIRFMTGLLAPLMLLFSIYLASGNIGQLWRGMFLLPLEFVGEHRTQLTDYGFTRIFLYITPLILGFLIRRKTSKTIFAYIPLIHFSVVLGLVIDAPNFGHHLIQLAYVPAYLIYAANVFFNNQLLSINIPMFFSVCLGLTMSILVSNYYIGSISNPLISQSKAVLRVSECLNNSAQPTPVNSSAYILGGTQLYSLNHLRPTHPFSIHPINVTFEEYRVIYFSKDIGDSRAIFEILKSRPTIIIFDNLDFLSPSQISVLQQVIQSDYSKICSNSSSGIQTFHREQKTSFFSPR